MNKLKIIDHQNKRVLTTAQLAEAYGTEQQIVVNNFNRNKERYTEGKHYIALRGEEKRQFLCENQFDFSNKDHSTFYLWTEKGAWMHAKSLNTDRAWEAYESLVDDYYSLKQEEFYIPQTLPDALRLAADLAEQNAKLQLETAQKDQIINELQPKASYVDQILKSKSTVTITQIAKDYGLSGQELNKILHDEGVQYKMNGQWLLYRKHQDQGLTKSQTVDIHHNDGSQTVKMNTRWTQKGRLFIHEILKSRSIIPFMDRQNTA